MKTIRVFLFTIFVFFLNNSSFGQEVTITSLLDQKQIAIQNGDNCIEINQQLYKLGHIPKAIVTELENNQIFFYYHQIIPPTKVIRINDRLKTYYDFIQHIDINTNDSFVIVHFNSNPTDYMIKEIVSHFAFEGYEKK
jgi:hypothetical protein